MCVCATGAPQEIDPELKRVQEMLQEVGYKVGSDG
jgi:hypothetical protein